MNREEFEHIVRAAADVVEEEIVVIGSQAILAQHPEAPEDMLRSAELDVFPLRELDKADDIDGAIGDGSPFHEQYGYYAHGVGPEALIAPAGWEDRLVKVELSAAQRKGGTVVAWCLEKHDLILAKLAAGRPHDQQFVDSAIKSKLVDIEQLHLGVDLLPESHREIVRKRLAAQLRSR
jgi:hypothetical protein